MDAGQTSPKARPGDPVAATGQDDRVTAASRPCGPRAAAVAGGFQQGGESTDDGGEFEGFYESARGNDRWRVSGSHYGAGTNTLVAIAYCD